MKNVIIGLGAFILIAMLGLGIADNFGSTPAPASSTSMSDTAQRSSFIQGCKTADGVTEATCACMYDNIVAEYGSDYILDSASRWRDDGFTEAEYDLIRICV